MLEKGVPLYLNKLESDPLHSSSVDGPVFLEKEMEIATSL